MDIFDEEIGETIENEIVPIHIRDQYILLNRVAEGYKTLGKILMEYIDNSFDSAENFFNGNQYSRKLLVTVKIERKEGRISISDNCEGMDKARLRGLANSINDSPKRKEQTRAWVTGQFGLGAHAFRLFAESLTVISRKRNSIQSAIEICRDSSDAHIVYYPSMIEYPSGTIVVIDKVDKRALKDLALEKLQEEVETYFEMFLRRNVEIRIIDDEKETVCQPFNYDKVPGKQIERKITSWSEGNYVTTVPEERAIEIKLKVCSTPINRPPYFSLKGRRINFVGELKTFISRTNHRKRVWENCFLTGYIEVNGNLKPVITRDDFETGRGKAQKRIGIYDEIIKLEDEIYDAIEEVNRGKNDEDLQVFASYLADILSKMAKEDELRILQDGQEQQSNTNPNEYITFDENSDERFEIIPQHKGVGPIFPSAHEIEKAISDPDGGRAGKKYDPQRPGLQIAFSTLQSIVPVRSVCGDGTITIFTSHPDFLARKHSTRDGDITISARLANYLAGVISSEYKELIYKQKKLEPERKKVLDEQIDFIFRFEELMKPFIDQPLGALGQFKAANA